jgi:hypothetical protein
MRSVLGLEELWSAPEARTGFEHQLVYRRPVALLLAGDLAQPTTVLDESVTALGDRNDLAATDFRRFAEALRSRLSPS